MHRGLPQGRLRAHLRRVIKLRRYALTRAVMASWRSAEVHRNEFHIPVVRATFGTDYRWFALRIGLITRRCLLSAEHVDRLDVLGPLGRVADTEAFARC